MTPAMILKMIAVERSVDSVDVDGVVANVVVIDKVDRSVYLDARVQRDGHGDIWALGHLDT